jgi:hypothetical protein
MRHISRKAAKAKGQTWYFTGKLCKQGHVSKRWVSSGQCHGCMAVYRASPQGQKVFKAAFSRYNASPLGFERNIRYRKGPVGIDSYYQRRHYNPKSVEQRRRMDRSRYERRKTWRKQYVSRPDVKARISEQKRGYYNRSVGKIDILPRE